MCAKDQAGWVTCAEDSVGVPLKPTLDKKIDPINQGKLFVVAEDTLFWAQAPDEFGYRYVHFLCMIRLDIIINTRTCQLTVIHLTLQQCPQHGPRPAHHGRQPRAPLLVEP